MRNLGSSVSSNLGLAPVVITAGGAADNVAQNGPGLSREDFEGAVVAAVVAPVLAAGQSVTLTVRLQHRQPNDAWTDFSQAQEVINAGEPASLIELDADLTGALSEVRVSVTADLSAASVDTCTVAAVLVLGEAMRGPV